jgi:hypothetical protein
MGADYAVATSRGAKEKKVGSLKHPSIVRPVYGTTSQKRIRYVSCATFHKIAVADSQTDDKSLPQFYCLPTDMTKATIAEIQLLLGCRPFLPFLIVTRSGQKYRVASPEHAGINPRGSRLHVWFDDDTGVTIAEANIVALEKDVQPATA